MINNESPRIPCPLCQSSLTIGIAKSKTGKLSLSLKCPLSGKHFRGFIADRDYVSRVMDRMESDQ